MGLVIFNGISSTDYGILVEHPPGYQTPARDYEVIHIPGRNGDLVIDSGSYQNVSRTYDIAFGDETMDFAGMANRTAEWLHSASGYARLEDSYEPEYYRMAMFQDEMDLENILQHAGRATVSFNCKPQRFLKTGENLFGGPDYFLNNIKHMIIRNPTGFCSLPQIHIYGQGPGDVSIGDYRVGIIEGDIVLDCDIQNVYGMHTNSINRNFDVILYDDFPKLVPGNNYIEWAGNISHVEILPRWWTL